jgi:hypothetical protein
MCHPLVGHRVVLLDRVTDMLIFFGKLLVVAIVGKRSLHELTFV